MTLRSGPTRQFASGEQVEHWKLFVWSMKRRQWSAHCSHCGAMQWLTLRRGDYVPRCKSCGASASGTRAKYLTGG